MGEVAGVIVTDIKVLYLQMYESASGAVQQAGATAPTVIFQPASSVAAAGHYVTVVSGQSTINDKRWRIFTCAQKLANSQLNLPHGTKQKKTDEETENKNGDAQKKRSSHKAVESVLRPEGSLWGKRYVKAVGLEPGVKEIGSYGW